MSPIGRPVRAARFAPVVRRAEEVIVGTPSGGGQGPDRVDLSGPGVTVLAPGLRPHRAVPTRI